MKTWSWLALAAFVACSADSSVDTVAQESNGHHEPAKVFPPDAHPFGRSMVQWSQRWWKWIFSIPAPQNPFLDPTGEDCAVGQEGPVWFLAGIADPGMAAAFTRTCTVPEGKALLITPASVLNDFPCPDPNFKPAPGQSLFDFLSEGAAAIVDGDTPKLVVDGDELDNPFDFRFASRHLFDITGDLSLQTTLDGCIIGTPQPAVSDGYFYMVKPLRPGPHQVTVSAVTPRGYEVSLTYNLTIAGH
jgi:hypothetical protein